MSAYHVFRGNLRSNNYKIDPTSVKMDERINGM